MASTDSAHINGNYAPQAYENNYATGASNFTPSQQPTAQPAQQAAEVPKDEVGWYFVEQYYTTLSKSPERLYVSLPLRWVMPRATKLIGHAAFLQQALSVCLRRRGGKGQRLCRTEGMETAHYRRPCPD